MKIITNGKGTGVPVKIIEGSSGEYDGFNRTNGWPRWPIKVNIDTPSSSAVVTMPRACSSITNKLIPNDYSNSCVHPETKENLVLNWHSINASVENKYMIIRNHFDRLLSCYYANVVHTSLQNKNTEKYYGTRSTFENFIKAIPDLLKSTREKAHTGEIEHIPTWHYAPYDLMLHVGNLPQELANAWMVVDAYQFHHLMDHLIKNGAMINQDDVRKRLDTITKLEYAKDYSPYAKDLHKINFLDWREVEQKPTYELMYTDEMIEIVEKCYSEDFRLFPRVMKFNRGNK